MKKLIMSAALCAAMGASAFATDDNWMSAGKRLGGSPVGNPISSTMQELARRDYLLRTGEGLGQNTSVYSITNTTAGCIINDTSSTVYDKVNGSDSTVTKTTTCTVSGPTTGTQTTSK